MSGEYLMAQSRWPQYEDGSWLTYEEAHAVLLERARALRTRDACRIYDDCYAQFCDHWEEVDGLAEEEYDEGVAKIARDRLVAAVEAICAGGLHNEAVLAQFAGEAWLLTGGISYGDAPTAVYDDVILLAESGIGEAPVVRSGAAA